MATPRTIEVGSESYSEKDWYTKNKWVTDEGKVLLEGIGDYLNSYWVSRAEELTSIMKGDPKGLSRRRKLSIKAFAFEQEEDLAADDYSKRGGDTVNPKMFTTSFPGKERGVLFKRLQDMRLKIGSDGDYHAMNDKANETLGRAQPFPQEWLDLFEGTRQWKAVQKHLRKQGRSILKKNTYTGKNGPEWFTDHWGPSALYCAKNTQDTGSGVLIFKSWWAFDLSPWCELEFLFCKCLAVKFPRSVYVVTGFSKEEGKSLGYFMKGDEKF